MTVAAVPALDLDPILGALDAEQCAAATLPDGPAQIVAPAGSGKTTTMVARLAVLLSRGVAPDRIRSRSYGTSSDRSRLTHPLMLRLGSLTAGRRKG